MKGDSPSSDPKTAITDQIAALSPQKRALLDLKLKKSLPDGHTLVSQSLKRLGVTHVYSVPGTPIGQTLAACVREEIRAIGVRHQQAGIMMAASQNYVTGNLTATAILSPGPGVTNASTGILVAHDNCWPLVVLGGQRPLSMQGMGAFQELDAIPIFQSITKWSARVETTAAIPEYLDRAFHVAIHGRPGPVYLELPEDILEGTDFANECSSIEPVEPPAVEPTATNQAADILLRAKRPGIILGKGLRWSEPYQELQHLVNGFGLPFITSPMGQGYLPDDHPLCYNAVRGLFQSQADAILLLGARLDWTFRFGTQLAADAKLIQVDIHAQAMGLNVTPTLGIVSDAKQFLQQLITQLAVKEGAYPRAGVLDAWCQLLAERRKDRLCQLDSQMNSDSMPMSPHRMIKEIREFLPRDAICILDGNVIMAVAQQALPSYVPVSRLTAGSDGCMGVGIPFGIGAKLSHPDRLVITICGDTAFGFNAMDMETAVRHRVPLIVVVANNDGNSGALTQEALFPPNHERVSMFKPAIHYEHIMAAFGGHSEFVRHPRQLKPALERAVASGTAACINVQVDPRAEYPAQ